MSARGRNTAEHRQDALGAYDTPLGVCRAAWAEMERMGEFKNVRRILEPHVGAGNWLRAMPESIRSNVEIEIMDIDPMAPAFEVAGAHGWDITPCKPARSLVRSGFMVTEPKRRPDLVIGNVPFSVLPPPLPCSECEALPDYNATPIAIGGCRACKGTGLVNRPAVFVATHHLLRALRVTKRHTVFLFRVGFVGSSKRLPLFRRIRPRHEWRLFPRPRFRWGGSDSQEYSILWYDRDWSRRAPDLRSWTTSVLEWKPE